MGFNYLPVLLEIFSEPYYFSGETGHHRIISCLTYTSVMFSPYQEMSSSHSTYHPEGIIIIIE